MGVGIGLGCAEFPFSGAAAYWRWIDMCEAGGVDSIWQTDRIVGHQPFLESITTMAALAGRTRRMRFGMNVVSLAFRDPVLLAKQCATIDVLSEGRLLPAFGIGSPLAPEWQALGIDTRTRGRKTDECLEIIRRLWREESVDFNGAFYKLKGVTIAPKPVQPELPMWIGGSTDAAIRRTARISTGWQAGGEPPAEAGRVVAAIKAAASEAGRSIGEDHYGAGFAFHFGSLNAPAVGRAIDAYAKRTGRDATHAFAVGDVDTILARVAEYVDAGVSKFILRPLGGDDNAILAQTRLLTQQVLPLAQAVAETFEGHHDRQITTRNPTPATRSASDATRERTMRIGGAMFFTDYSMSPTELARALEGRGFDSLWVPEHSHIPLTRKSPFPSGGDLPKKYYDVMDPFVVLGAAAAVTKTLLLGTGICLIAQRDAIQTAKQVASIDQISGGRFLFGVGSGWNEDEMANHGTAFASRHKLARERIEAMQAIWTKSKAEYHGEFVNFDPMMTWPKPVQKPHPPIMVGGAFPYGARRALSYGNGWMPHRTRTQYADVQALLPKFREMAAEAGRDLASVPITIWGAKENLDLLKRDRDDGVSRVVVSFDSAKADTILPELDRWATLIRQLGS